LNRTIENKPAGLWVSGLSDIDAICNDYYGQSINRNEIFAEKIKILYAGSAYRPLLHVIPTGFIFLLTYGHIDLLVSLIWLLVMFAINVMRYVDIRQVQPVLHEQEDFVLLRNRFARYTFTLGVMYGAGAIYFSIYIPATSQLILLSMMATMMPAAIISFSSDRLTFFSFFLPILIPILIQQLVWGNLMNLYISLVTLIYIVVIIAYFSWHRRLLVDALCHRIASSDHIVDLVNTNKELQLLSGTDSLTGMANRRLFDFTLNREWRRMKRSRLNMSLVFIDIDCFGKYNEVYGKQTGDESLQAVARVIVESCNRPLDMAARYGRDKFAVLLPETTLEDAVVVARKARHAIEKLSIENKACEENGVLTVSMGVSSTELRRAHNDNDLVAFADESLGLARKSGGNSIITAGAIAT
jgi:diguanylate cyclase (GGDEF)-like protein